MTTNLFTGSLVRLAPGRDEAVLWAKWGHDTQYIRLLDSEPQQPSTESRIRKENDNETLPDGKGFGFGIRTLADDRLLGFFYLGVMSWIHRDAWVAIGIGDREFWGKGYGTDAMRVGLRYAFDELHLHRVSLTVYGNNARAMRSYEKAGFKREGSLPEAMFRDGEFIDIVHMGMLRAEWQS